jgi:hypothetical protein
VTDTEPVPGGESAATCRVDLWDNNGAASLVVSGNDRRAVIEAGLRAVLRLVTPARSAASEASRAVPVRGIGADLSALFADIAADLLAQIEELGAGLSDVAVDGVVQGEAGQYVAWGYAFGPLDASANQAVSVQIDVVEVSAACGDTGTPIELRARLRRG